MDGTYKTFDGVVQDLRDDVRVGGFFVQGWDATIAAPTRADAVVTDDLLATGDAPKDRMASAS